jgi:propanediol dehydratase small subunit
MSTVALIRRSERLSWLDVWRARKLTKSRTRRRLAAGFERALADAEAPAPRLSAAIPVRRPSVAACRDELLELVERLRSPSPVYAQGVELGAELLKNAASPLYQPSGDLRAAIEAALEALDGHIG